MHIYTGNGKGKTTAATGLALRAAGAGKRVLFAQFMKSGTSSEQTAMMKFSDSIILRWYGVGGFIKERVSQDQVDSIQKGLKEVGDLMMSGIFELVILDESITCLKHNLIAVEQLLTLINNRPSRTEIVLTGRDAPKELVDAADLVTEMMEIKHYYNKGISARRGIEF